MKKIEKYIKSLLSEAAKINFAGHTFVLKIDTNEDPQKKGVKVQFLPTKFGSITPTEQNDIAIELEKRLEGGLAEYELRVERDRNLKDKTISSQDAETKLNELKNVQKTKEYNNVVSSIKNLKNEKIKEAKASKLSEYNKIFSVINDKKDATISLSKLIEAAISKSINNKKTDKKALLYSCIKLEILANLESLKKDAALRQQIQLEMLTSKFNKSNSGDLNDLDSLVINFIENYSKEDSGAPEKALWNRISKTLEVLVS